MPVIEVKLPTASYPIVIEPGSLKHLGDVVQAAAPHSRAALIIDQAIVETHAAEALASLMSSGITPLVITLDADEMEKNLDTVHRAYRGLIKSGLERRSPVIAMGGGVIGDIAGFVAATYLRGVPLIQVPTTLLAMVDASIGGKTGVNFRLPDKSLGKNLIGAFHQPRAVIADPMVLRTLGARDFRCGLAECIKHAMIADAKLLAFIERHADRILEQDTPVLTELIVRCATIKVEIVQKDEREEGRRALLNLGHTFAHVIEPRRPLGLRHGEAVSIGLVAAMSCAVATRRMKPSEARRLRNLLVRVGLPVRMKKGAPVKTLMASMGYDKKVKDGQLRLILPRGIGRAEIVTNVRPALIEAAWREIGAA